jgi:hypothetical protein
VAPIKASKRACCWRLFIPGDHNPGLGRNHCTLAQFCPCVFHPYSAVHESIGFLSTPALRGAGKKELEGRSCHPKAILHSAVRSATMPPASDSYELGCNHVAHASSHVRFAISSSSSVGMTKAVTCDSGTLIRVSALRFASSSSLNPRQAQPPL